MSQRDPNYYKDKKSKKRFGRKSKKHRAPQGGSTDQSNSSNASTTTTTTSEDGQVGFSQDSQLYDMRGGYSEAPQQQQVVQGDVGELADVEPEFSQEFLDAPANVKWNKLVMHCSAEVSMKKLQEQMFKTGSGDIVFSLGNKNMFFEHSDNGYDLEKADKRSKYAKDIVKTLRIEALHAPGLDQAQTLISVNIDRFDSEFWYSGSEKSAKQINRMLLTGELSKLQGPLVLLDRTQAITNQTILWQNQHPDARPGNLQKGIRKLDNDNYLLSTKSPIHSLYMQLHPNTTRQEVAGLDDRVRVSGRFVKKYLPMTEKAMKNNITYASLTSGEGIVVTFSRVIPQEKLQAHRDYVASVRAGGKIVGSPYMGFAAPLEQTGVDEMITIQFRLVAEYLSGSKPIEITMPLEQH